MLCHTGLVWETTVDGRVLHFHLSGINNQNFLMRDEETGSWWQQVSGEAILGPLKGHRLQPVPQDELSFALWKGEHPPGRVLRPDPAVQAKGDYAPVNWEAQIERLPLAAPNRDSRLAARELVAGVVVDGRGKAYTIADLRQQTPVADLVGRVPVLIVAAPDGRSVRAFRRVVDGRTLELFAVTGHAAPSFVDTATGSEWDFSGRAVRGPLQGRQLPKVEVLKDYWFDWRTYHPRTEIFHAGLRRPAGASASLAR
jgi:hypothetical protein